MKVACDVKRQNPGESPYWQRYAVELEKGTTLLGLLNVLSRLDRGLAYTMHHCKTGICGGCRLLVNGKQRLGCRTIVDTAEIRLEPLPHLPIIKDLVVDFLSATQKRSKRRSKRHEADVDTR